MIFTFISTFINEIGDDNTSVDEMDGDVEEPTPSCGDYIMHFLTLFWKILFAFIPPTGKLYYDFVHIVDFPLAKIQQ